MLMIFDWELRDCETNEILDFGDFECMSRYEVESMANKFVPPCLKGTDWEKECDQEGILKGIKCNNKYKFIYERVPSRTVRRTL